MPDEVDLIVLDHASLELAGRVAMWGVLLFDDDPAARVEWQATTRKIYLDEEPRQREIDRIFFRSNRDERRSRRMLQRVTDDLAHLRRAASSEALPGDEDLLAATKYRFLTAIEAAIDAAQHICASEGWGPPESNRDAFAVLACHGALTADIAERMASAVGFRNLLVHGYDVVDDGRVVAHLQDLGALADFAADMSRWIAAQE